jgi:ribosome-binding ATPase
LNENFPKGNKPLTRLGVCSAKGLITMAVSAGIVGLPNVGKSTLFNAITQAGAESANYPFCTIDPNVGIVQVPDQRLYQLAEIIPPERIVPTAYEFVDIAGLVQGASRGEGLGNKFLANIREVDAIAHVVRCFEDGNVTHVSGNVDPVRDIETIELELILADLETAEKRLERVKKIAKSGDRDAKLEQQVLTKVTETLEREELARTLHLTDEEAAVVKQMHLLTMKPVLFVANVSEDEIGTDEENAYVQSVRQFAVQRGDQVVVISAKVEAEIAELEGDDREMFLEELGLEESGLDKLIRATLISSRKALKAVLAWSAALEILSN